MSELCDTIASETAAYQCFYIHLRDGVSSLNAQQTSQSRKSHNFIQPGGKSSDILQTVSTITKFIPTVPVNRIVVLENETPSAIVYTS